MVREADILHNFLGIPHKALKDLILVLITEMSKYLTKVTEYFPFSNESDNRRFRDDLILCLQEENQAGVELKNALHSQTIIFEQCWTELESSQESTTELKAHGPSI